MIINKNTLSRVIESFDEWQHPWFFFDFIIKSKSLTDEEIIEFKDLYNSAADLRLWNSGDLKEGYKNTVQYLKSNTELSELAIRQIANAVAYKQK